jgi:replicative DNA helicase
MTSGLQAGDLIIGHDQMETSFAINIAVHVAIYEGLPVAVSMEMEQNNLRFVSWVQLAESTKQTVTGHSRMKNGLG